MDAAVTKPYLWRQTALRWQSWLRRHGWYLGLLLLLVFSTLEPFACLIRCQFWTASNPTAGHHHAHGMPHRIGIDEFSLARPATFGGSQHGAGQPHVGTPFQKGQYNLSAHQAAFPDREGARFAADALDAFCAASYTPSFPSHHEHLAALIIVMILPLASLIRRIPISSPYPPPQIVYRPPLRPPIRIALSH